MITTVQVSSANKESGTKLVDVVSTRTYTNARNVSVGFQGRASVASPAIVERLLVNRDVEVGQSAIPVA